MAKTKTSITPEKRKTMKPRGKGKQSLMLEAVRAVCGSEQEFLKSVISIGLGSVDNETSPNPVLLTLALNRIEPPLKSIAPLIKFDFDADAKPHEQANQVLVAIADGCIAPDIGQMFISSIKSMIDIEEYTDLKERIEKLEKALAGDS